MIFWFSFRRKHLRKAFGSFRADGNTSKKRHVVSYFFSVGIVSQFSEIVIPRCNLNFNLSYFENRIIESFLNSNISLFNAENFAP